MNKNFVFTLAVFSLLLFSCADSKPEKQITTAPEITVPEVQNTVVDTPKYKMLPSDVAKNIYDKANGLEGTFYNSGKSISLWNENVQGIFGMMLENAPTVLDNNIVGHIMLLADGEQLAFVEISLNGNNNYAIYKVNDEVFYNTLSPKGLEFLQGMNTRPELVTK